jgi:hypothetical protein
LVIYIRTGSFGHQLDASAWYGFAPGFLHTVVVVSQWYEQNSQLFLVFRIPHSSSICPVRTPDALRQRRFLVGVFTMIGTAVGELGLRSIWCSQAYADSPKEQFMPDMQYIVWLGILAACVSLSFLTGIYYNSEVPYLMGKAASHFWGSILQFR